MNEILPPAGINKKYKFGTKTYITISIIMFPVAFALGWVMVKYENNSDIRLISLAAVLVIILAILPISYSAQRNKVVTTVRNINKDEITLAEVKSNISMLWMWSFWVQPHLIAAIKKGYLPEYKYLKNEKLLVRIGISDVNSFSPR